MRRAARQRRGRGPRRVFSGRQVGLFAPGAPPQAVALGMEQLHACRREALMMDAMVAQAMRLEETARSLRVPTLSLDRVTPPALSERLAALIPGAAAAHHRTSGADVAA